MIKAILHHAVNWVDGMKISQKHFASQENHFLDSIRDTTSYSINKFNYGLLPIGDIEVNNSIFDVFNSATNDIQLIIKKCHAITPAGYRVAINNMTININELTGSIKNEMEEEDYYILIAVNPFEQIPGGEFDPEETPPRHLFTQAKYHIQLVSVNINNNENSSGNYIIAGKVQYKNGMANTDVSFIPPCTTVNSHPLLLRYYQDFARIIGSLQQFATRIIQKNNYKNQNVALTQSIKELCSVMLNQFGNSYFYYRNISYQIAPIYMIDIFSKLAHNLYIAIEKIPEKEKEEALNYCYEWSDIPPHLLLNQLSTIVEINYDHYKNGEYMKSISLLLNSLYNIWEKLSGLEYIGQHKENIVVKEQALTQMVKDKKGWNILD
jgi:hypothetical protein